LSFDYGRREADKVVVSIKFFHLLSKIGAGAFYGDK